MCYSCKKDEPTPDTTPPTAPTNLVASNITTNSLTISWTASTDNIAVASYTVYVNGAAQTPTSSTTFSVNNLSASTVYDVYVKAKDTSGNTAKSESVEVTTLMPTPTAVVNANTSFEGSATAVDKVLLGGSIAKGFVLNVTNAGTAKVEVIGSTTNGSPAVAYYWINSADNSDINIACSTLNSKVAKTAITSQSFMINLSAGTNVLCFKTARYSGLITNGGEVGLKITFSNAVFTTIGYTADAVSGNVAGVIKQEYGTNNNVTCSSNWSVNDFGAGWFKLTPYSDENANVYDGTLYPKILSLTLSTTIEWCSGSISNWNDLDFTNALGTAGQNFVLENSDNGPNLFDNVNATFSNKMLEFSSAGSQIVKSAYNFAYLPIRANVYNNSSSQFGPASVCFYHKSVHYVGNPELWIYNPSGNRFQ